MDGWMEKMDGWMDGEDGWIERGEASGWNRREASRQEVELHLKNMQYQTKVPATRTLRYPNFCNLETTENAFFSRKWAQLSCCMQGFHKRNLAMQTCRSKALQWQCA